MENIRQSPVVFVKKTLCGTINIDLYESVARYSIFFHHNLTTIVKDGSLATSSQLGLDHADPEPSPARLEHNT